MARKSKSQAKFSAPRGSDGKFLPRDQWPKSVRKEFEKLKKNGAFKNPTRENPIVTSSRGRRKGKDIWIPPQNKATGQFLPMDEWSASEKRAYRKALREGLVPGTLVPRGYSGRFSTAGAPQRRKARQVEEMAIYQRPQDEEPYELYDIKRGIRRLEHRIEDLTDEFDRAARRAGARRDVEQYTSAEVQEFCRRCGRTHRRPVRTTQLPTLKPSPKALPEHDIGEDALEEYERTGIKREDWPVVEEPIDVEYCEDPCDAEILEAARGAQEACEKAETALAEIRPMVANRSFSRNRAIRTLMYNRPRSVGQGFDSIVEYVKEHPVLAIVGIGTAVVVGYAIYRLIRSIVSTISVGTEIRNGVMSFPGVTPYRITQEDSVWLLRSIWGEVNRSNRNWDTADVQRGAAAVLWAMANNYMTVGRKRTLFSTFGDFVQAYSQPINPAWVNPDGAKCQQSPAMCTSEMIAFRRALRSKPWSEFPAEAQAIVTAFVNGALPNPVGSRTDFRAANRGYRPPDPLTVAGNTFGTDPDARRRGTATTSTAVV